MDCDVAIIGAGPAGAAMASMLNAENYRVTILERSVFPRFSIGESLLPQSMVFLKQCGLLKDIPPDTFQLKKGALFRKNNQKAHIDFSFKFTEGPETTWQVLREEFDTLLINAVQKSGAEVYFDTEVTDFDQFKDHALVHCRDKTIKCRFVIDASGSAMILPRLMKTIEKPVLEKASLFGHFANDSRNEKESNNILISVHPQDPTIWYWGIPLADGKISVGVTSDANKFSTKDSEELLKYALAEPALKKRLQNATMTSKVGFIKGYTASVNQIYGERFLQIGNAGGFLDPIFSSGMTVALKTAVEGFRCVKAILEGNKPDWNHYMAELELGNKTFKACIDAWYEGSLQDIIFSDNKTPEVQKKLNSILAGYAWDRNNSFVGGTSRKIKQLHRLIQR